MRRPLRRSFGAFTVIALMLTVEAATGVAGAGAARPSDARSDVQLGQQDGSGKAAKKAKKAKKKKAKKSSDTSSGSSTASGSLKAKTGRITLGGRTIDVVADQVCTEFAGQAMVFRGSAVADPDVKVTLAAGVDPEMGIRDETADTFYRAGDVYVDSGATVPETSIRGGTATGTATLTNVNAPPRTDTVEGSFEFRC